MTRVTLSLLHCGTAAEAACRAFSTKRQAHVPVSGRSSAVLQRFSSVSSASVGSQTEATPRSLAALVGGENPPAVKETAHGKNLPGFIVLSSVCGKRSHVREDQKQKKKSKARRSQSSSGGSSCNVPRSLCPGVK